MEGLYKGKALIKNKHVIGEERKKRKEHLVLG